MESVNNDLHFVHIESATYCNAKCKMCPHSDIKRKGMMEYELFTSIVNQAMDLGCQDFSLFRLGEPLIFPQLFKWLDYLQVKGARACIYTNGAALTPDIGKKLKEYAEVFRDFTISFHGHDAESYEEMTGLNFNNTRKKIIEFMKDDPMRVNIYRLANDPGNVTLKEKFENLWDGFGFREIGVSYYMEWAGNIEGFTTIRTMADEGTKVEIIPCRRIFKEVDVLFDGTVVLCCLDAHGEITFGNLQHDSLEQALNHKLRQYYQEKHLSGDSEELPLCKYCSTKMEVQRNV